MKCPGLRALHERGGALRARTYCAYYARGGGRAPGCGRAQGTVADLAETLLGALESIATLRAELSEQGTIIEGLLAPIAEVTDGHAAAAVGAEVLLALEAKKVDPDDVES